MSLIHEIMFGGMVKSYLIQGDENCILIDAGIPGGIDTFLKRMGEIGIAPEKISLMIITHGHWDHIGSANAIKERSGAKIAIHYLEKDGLETGKTPNPRGLTKYGKILGFFMRCLPERVVSGVKADIILDDDGMDLHAYGIPGKIVHTPGHTAGSISVVLESGETLVGDLAMSAKFMRLTPGVPIVGDDVDMIHKSWQVLLDFGAQTIYPSHGKRFSADVFRIRGLK